MLSRIWIDQVSSFIRTPVTLRPSCVVNATNVEFDSGSAAGFNNLLSEVSRAASQPDIGQRRPQMSSIAIEHVALQATSFTLQQRRSLPGITCRHAFPRSSQRSHICSESARSRVVSCCAMASPFPAVRNESHGIEPGR